MEKNKKSDRKFIAGSGRNHIFKDGGQVINMYLKKSDLMNIKENEQGYIRFIIGEKPSPDAYKNTHYAYEDTFVPEPQAGNSVKANDKPSGKTTLNPKDATDDLPF
jgi:hypothetical protein